MTPGGHPDEVPLTDEERLAIRALQRLAKKWPRSLWLYSASGTLCVMRRDSEGRQAFTGRNQTGCVDAAYKVAFINIPNDGGDW